MAQIDGGSIVWDLDIKDADFQAKLEGARKSVSDFASSSEKQFSSLGQKVGNSLKGVGENVKSVGISLIGLGVAPTLALVGAAKAASDFESSFAGVRKTVDASEPEFKQLSENFRQISRVTPLAVDDLNRIGEIAGSLGVSGVANLTKFTKTIAEVGITSNLTEDQAAMAFGQIANIMQEPIDNIDRMGATVIDLGNKLAATESDITDFATRIAGAGKIAGLSTRDVFGIGAAMASVGVEAEAGGTAVQKVLIDINKAVVTGNKNLATFAKTSGLSAEEFKKSWKQSAGETFTAFVLGLGKEGDQAIQTLSDLGLEDQRLIRAFLSLANAGDLVNTSLNTAGDAWRANTALTAEAEKRYATTASQIQIAKNNLTDIGITIGSAVLPPLNSLLQSLKPLFEGFSNFAKNNPTLVAGLLGVGAAVGALGVALVALGAVISAVGTIMTAFGAIAAIALSPITLTIAGIALAVGLLYIAWANNFLGIQNVTQAFMTWFNTNVTPVITTAWDTIKKKIEEVVTWFDTTGKPIFTAALEIVKVVVSDVMGVFKTKFDIGYKAAKDLIDFIKNTFQPDFDKTMNLVSATIDALIPGWVKQLGSVTSAFGDIANAIGNVIGKIDELTRKVTGTGISGNFLNGLLSGGTHLPFFAGGVRNFEGGFAVTGERGPELAYYPKGTDIFSNDETLDMFADLNQSKQGSINNGPFVVVENMEVRDDSDIRDFAREIAFDLELSPGFIQNG